MSVSPFLSELFFVVVVGSLASLQRRLTWRKPLSQDRPLVPHRDAGQPQSAHRPQLFLQPITARIILHANSQLSTNNRGTLPAALLKTKQESLTLFRLYDIEEFLKEKK